MYVGVIIKVSIHFSPQFKYMYNQGKHITWHEEIDLDC